MIIIKGKALENIMQIKLMDGDMDKIVKPVEAGNVGENVMRRIIRFSAAVARALGDPEQLWKSMK